jgi:hypothetical protein
MVVHKNRLAGAAKQAASALWATVANRISDARSRADGKVQSANGFIDDAVGNESRK